jgi:hypothetical protein
VLWSLKRPPARTWSTPLHPELRATATILVAEHARAAPNPAEWRVAVVVLRYFVAVRLAKTPRASRFSGAVGSPRTEAYRERGSLGAGRGPASLEVNNSAPDTSRNLGTKRVLVLCLPKAWGPARAEGGCAGTLSLFPALVIRTSELRGIEPGPPARTRDSCCVCCR